MKSIMNTFCFFIPVASIRQHIRTQPCQRRTNKKNNPWTCAQKLNKRPIILWIEDALGRQSDIYSGKKIKEMEKNFNVLQLRHFPQTQLYHLTFACNQRQIWTTHNIDAIADFLCEFRVEKILINNPDTDKNTSRMLHAIAYIKQNCLGCACVSLIQN